jgi:hypothetical protein
MLKVWLQIWLKWGSSFLPIGLHAYLFGLNITCGNHSGREGIFSSTVDHQVQIL